MKRTLLVACAALSLAPAVYGQGTPVSETIPLHYLGAMNVPTVIKTLQGLDQFTVEGKATLEPPRGTSKP